jgi:hypothetical protein
MIKNYPLKNLLLVAAFLLLIVVASCKKDNTNNNNTPVTKTVVNATPAQLGLYAADSSIFKILLTAISKIGTNTTDYGLQFDTGSGGLVIDAADIIPANIITSSGFKFTGDSTVVNGITITNKTTTITYGDDATSLDKVYGNLAYAQVVVGDVAGGEVTIKRLAFFLYYKAVDYQGNLFPKHEFDIFGVSPEYDISFSNGVTVQSPLSYYEPGTGLTKGFILSPIPASTYSYAGTYVPGAVTMGLTSSNLSSSSGYTFHDLANEGNYGYSPLVRSSLSYNNGKPFASDIVFDTGTEPYSYLEDPTAVDTIALLPANSPVAVTTSDGFAYNYTTTNTENLTLVENPTLSGAEVSILSLEFFLTNYYMLDYDDHKLGTKNE